MQLPDSIVGFIFPAQRYLRRQRQVRIRQFRQRHDPAEPKPPADGMPLPNGPTLARIRQRQAAAERLEREQAELLRSTASELDRTTEAKIVTESGMIRAQIKRFRWGADVLEITHSSRTGRSGSSRCVLQRSASQLRTKVLVSNLAMALAALEPRDPPAEPLVEPPG